MRRVVLDTNCLLATLPSKSPYHKLWSEFMSEKLELCVSNEILYEYEEIISQIINPTFANIVINTLLNKPNVVRISPTWRFGLITKDYDDNKFVDCAVCGMAECIVSNDKHFKDLKNTYFPPVKVYAIKDFCNSLQ